MYKEDKTSIQEMLVEKMGSIESGMRFKYKLGSLSVITVEGWAT